jgi:hypothetical protein
MGNWKNPPQHGKPIPAFSLDAPTFYGKNAPPSSTSNPPADRLNVEDMPLTATALDFNRHHNRSGLNGAAVFMRSWLCQTKIP